MSSSFIGLSSTVSQKRTNFETVGPIAQNKDRF